MPGSKPAFRSSRRLRSRRFAASLEKIAQLRGMVREMGLETIIEVDGGISSHNAAEVYGAGADVLVAGNAVFGAADPQAEIVKMLNA